MARVCKYEKRCSLYVIPKYDDQIYRFYNESAKYRYVNYRLNHPIWLIEYEIREKYIKKARLTYIIRPR